MAVRQKLLEVYQAGLANVQANLETEWAGIRSRLETEMTNVPAVAFHDLILREVADSVVILDRAGSPTYPTGPSPHPLSDEVLPLTWKEAERLEYEKGDVSKAAEIFNRIAQETENIHLAARAIRAQARNLVKAGHIDEAIAVLATLQEQRFHDARDADGI